MKNMITFRRGLGISSLKSRITVIISHNYKTKLMHMILYLQKKNITKNIVHLFFIINQKFKQSPQKSLIC